MSILSFKDLYQKGIKKFNTIKLDDKDIHNCVLYIKRVVQTKHKTSKLVDNKTKYEELFKMVCALTALSKRCGFPLIDYKDLKTPPLEQLRTILGKWVDVIIFNHNEFPIFYHPMYKKSIFICKMSNDEYVICGYGTTYVVNSFHSKSLVDNQTIREQSVMSAFYGFEHLKIIPNNIYDFKNLLL
jgi:hypothetical protein